MVAGTLACGDGVGYDEVYVNQAWPDQRGFFEFYRREVLPRYAVDDVGLR